MLVIHPDEWIDCGVCEPEYPVDAIRPDTEPGVGAWLELNAKYAELRPVIIEQKTPFTLTDKWTDKQDKLQHLSEKPGGG